MLTDDVLHSLPDDPELAFIELVDHLDKWLAGANRPVSLDEYQGPPNYSNERRYAETLRAFADEHDLDVPFRSYHRTQIR
jgi:hypothetical protein